MHRQPDRVFARRLKETFGDRFRLRWSPQRHAWHIEQRVGRASLPPIRVDEEDDDLVRARDGYWLVCAIQPAPTMRCRCGRDIAVAIRAFKEGVCEYCKSRQSGWGTLRDGRTQPTGYWPLDDQLLDYLKYLDPERCAPFERARQQTLAALADAANHALLRSYERATEDAVRYGARHEEKFLFDKARVGYGSRQAKVAYDPPELARQLEEARDQRSTQVRQAIETLQTYRDWTRPGAGRRMDYQTLGNAIQVLWKDPEARKYIQTLAEEALSRPRPTRPVEAQDPFDPLSALRHQQHKAAVGRGW